MKIYNNILDLVGNTPLIRLNGYEKDNNLNAEIIAKLEGVNPAGSIKDRVAKKIILDAEEKGTLKKGYTIIEPTSGNTGIGLAAIGVSRGYRVQIVLPDTMSQERRTLIKSYGAELVLTDGALGMKGAIEKAEELHKENPKSIIAGQFTNPINPVAHYETTGPEIWNDTDGKVDYFVSGVGTGGTLTGTAKYLKEKNPNIKIIAVEPDTSAVLSGKKPGAHKLQGIGAGFIPDILDVKMIDEVIEVSADDAYNAARSVAVKDGVLVGISAGAALYAALVVAKRAEAKGKKIVVIFPDSGDKYLSTDLFK